MKIGYARVSTEDQNPDLQLTALKQAGCKRVFTDKATGAHVKRPELVKCFKALKEGGVSRNPRFFWHSKTFPFTMPWTAGFVPI